MFISLSSSGLFEPVPNQSASFERFCGWKFRVQNWLSAMVLGDRNKQMYRQMRPCKVEKASQNTQLPCVVDSLLLQGHSRGVCY